MRPRNLRVLRIDDVHFDLRRGTEAAGAEVIDALPAPLESFHCEDGAAGIATINSWSTALRLWSRLQAQEVPDLVLADVIFAGDESTPLVRVPGFKGYPRLIPTGISHLKPFAALARARERPLGIGIHTRNASVWADAWGDGHPMGALAAHEIGEVAAILGDLLEDESIEGRVELCWDWLKGRSRDDFPTALRIAMRDYRRRLVEAGNPSLREGVSGPPRALVMPQDWVRLDAWVDRRSRGEAAPIEADRSLPVLYSDGSRDLLRIASLFGEVKDIESRDLPPRCFERPGPAGRGATSEPWSLDDDGNPQIGRFIASLGRTATAYLNAATLVERFPLVHPEGQGLECTLLKEAEDYPDSMLVAGLAILFQVLKWEHRKFGAWREGLRREGWSFSRKRLTTPPASSLTLAEALFRLAHSARRFGGSPFLRGDVPQGEGADLFRSKAADNDGVRWHFDRLVDAGVLAFHPVDETYENVLSRRFSIDELPSPPLLPVGFFEDELGELRSVLRDSLGFGARYGPNRADNDQMIGKRLAVAFCDSADGNLGRELLDRILGGYGPPWLLELLRRYASDRLEWGEGRTWPRWLQTR